MKKEIPSKIFLSLNSILSLFCRWNNQIWIFLRFRIREKKEFHFVWHATKTVQSEISWNVDHISSDLKANLRLQLILSHVKYFSIGLMIYWSSDQIFRLNKSLISSFLSAYIFIDLSSTLPFFLLFKNVFFPFFTLKSNFFSLSKCNSYLDIYLNSYQSIINLYPSVLIYSNIRTDIEVLSV